MLPQTTPQAGSAKALRALCEKLSPQQRRSLIAIAAHYIAKHRGIRDDPEIEDWLWAEAAVDRLLAQGHNGGRH